MDKKTNNKLILHFDGRNTVFVSDFNQRLSTENALNSYISGLAWGKLVDDVWQIEHDTLSTNRPDPSLISFYKYMEEKIVKIPDDRPRLREKLGKFTEERGAQFRQVFLRYLEKLEWKYDYHEKFTVSNKDGKGYHYILPMFFNTIKLLCHNNRQFAIIIRTYGLDSVPMLNSIEAFLNGEHPMFPEKLNIPVHSRVNILSKDTDKNEYVYEFKVHNEGEVCQTTSERDIYEHWNSISGVAAVKDDYLFWMKNNYQYSASKPLWINYKSKMSDRAIHHIFFDDCISRVDRNSIVHLRRFDSDCALTDLPSSQSLILDPSETNKYIDVHLVPTNLLDCIDNENYFMEKIRLCEKNFENIYF